MKRRNIAAYVHDGTAEKPCDPRAEKIGRSTTRWLDVTCPRCIAGRKRA